MTYKKAQIQTPIGAKEAYDVQQLHYIDNIEPYLRDDGKYDFPLNILFKYENAIYQVAEGYLCMQCDMEKCKNFWCSSVHRSDATYAWYKKICDIPKTHTKEQVDKKSITAADQRNEMKKFVNINYKLKTTQKKIKTLTELNKPYQDNSLPHFKNAPFNEIIRSRLQLCDHLLFFQFGQHIQAVIKDNQIIEVRFTKSNEKIITFPLDNEKNK